MTKIEAIHAILAAQRVEDQEKEVAIHAILHGANINDTIESIKGISMGFFNGAGKELMITALKAYGSPTQTTSGG